MHLPLHHVIQGLQLTQLSVRVLRDTLGTVSILVLYVLQEHISLVHKMLHAQHVLLEHTALARAALLVKVVQLDPTKVAPELLFVKLVLPV